MENFFDRTFDTYFCHSISGLHKQKYFVYITRVRLYVILISSHQDAWHAVYVIRTILTVEKNIRTHNQKIVRDRIARHRGLCGTEMQNTVKLLFDKNICTHLKICLFSRRVRSINAK
jgi:hypothetical protein